VSHQHIKLNYPERHGRLCVIRHVDKPKLFYYW